MPLAEKIGLKVKEFSHRSPPLHHIRILGGRERAVYILAEENPAFRGIDINRDASRSVAGGVKDLKFHLSQTDLIMLAREDGIKHDRPVVNPVHAGGRQLIILALYASPVQFMGNDLAAVLIPPEVKSSDMIDVAVGGNNMPDLCWLGAQRSDVLLYLIISISYTSVY